MSVLLAWLLVKYISPVLILWASLGMWHVLTFSRITIRLLRRRSDRPVIGGDLADAHVPPG